MRAAIAADVPFEVDLRTTADDKVVLMHDSDIARTTTGSGAVAKMTGREIRRYQTDDGRIADGERVPCAAAVLRLVRDDPDARVYLDLKGLTRTTQTELAQRIAEYGIADRVTAISFHERELSGFHARTPSVSTYHIEKSRNNLPSVDDAEVHGGVNVYVGLMTQEWVDAMDSRGVPCSMRMDDHEEAWTIGLGFGVDSIITDDVAAYRAYCNA